MTRGERARLIRRLSRGQSDIDALADALYEAKVTVYIDTLRELAEEFGYELQGDFDLAEAILDALQDEAEAHAESIVDTFNADAIDLIDKQPVDASLDDVVSEFEQWAASREGWKAEEIAVTEAFTPHHDATVHFFQAAGLDPDAPAFEFGGHPEEGDLPSECVVCQRLEETSPHPLSEVVRIGNPHPRCAQSWHFTGDEDALPDRIEFGLGEPGGIVGQDTLVTRAGSHEAAAAQIGGNDA